MKKVAIVGLGWLGMPLAMSLSARGWQVTGSKTTQDGVEAARMMPTRWSLRFRHVVAAPAMSSIYKRYKS